MPGPVDTGPCTDCGKTVTTQRRYKRCGGRRDHLCTSCAVARAVAGMEQISRKSGPAYERWKEGFLRAADRLR